MKPEILKDEEILEASKVEMVNEDGSLNFDSGYLTGRRQVAEAQRDDTWEKASKYYGAIIRDLKKTCHKPSDMV